MRTIKTLNKIAGILLVCQFFGYVGSIKSEPGDASDTNPVAYYIGFNFALIIALVLLIISFSLKKKLKQEEQKDEIDSIGKNDSQI